MVDRNKGKNIALTSLFTALIAVGAFIKIPLAADIAITLQTLFVLLSGVLIGKKSFLSGLAYMVLGLIGVPIFTQGGGFNYVLKPTFGYILSFPIASLVIAILTSKKHLNIMQYFTINILAVLIIYAIGITYFATVMQLYFNSGWSLSKIFKVLFLSLIWKDIIVAFVAALVAVKVRPLVRKQSQS